MAQKVYIVEGRQFRNPGDYACAKRDKELIDRLRCETDFTDRSALEKRKADILAGKYHFQTLLGQDFLEEIEELLKVQTGSKKSAGAGKRAASLGGLAQRASRAEAAKQRQQTRAELQAHTERLSRREGRPEAARDKALEAVVQKELKKREARRKIIITACSLTAAFSLGYVGLYTYYNYRTENNYKMLSELREKTQNVIIAEAANPAESSGPLYTLDEEPEEKPVLEEYKKLLIHNKKLIGWVKIDDTNIDYPVMQTDDNEYYLKHNLNQQYDKNGSIFMDKDCDVLKPSTNFILYGHHTKTGQMFGKLELYQDEEYYKEHQYINFDTIYERGTYQIMYVFRSRVYREDEIVFKYYQFIDANGEQEFNSYMQEMAKMSFYDTGVTAEYGDQLLTLSTCDYQEKDGRFVIVAKKIAKE